jgi:hypothetical protein
MTTPDFGHSSLVAVYAGFGWSCELLIGVVVGNQYPANLVCGRAERNIRTRAPDNMNRGSLGRIWYDVTCDGDRKASSLPHAFGLPSTSDFLHALDELDEIRHRMLNCQLDDRILSSALLVP